MECLAPQNYGMKLWEGKVGLLRNLTALLGRPHRVVSCLAAWDRGSADSITPKHRIYVLLFSPTNRPVFSRAAVLSIETSGIENCILSMAFVLTVFVLAFGFFVFLSLTLFPPAGKYTYANPYTTSFQGHFLRPLASSSPFSVRSKARFTQYWGDPMWVRKGHQSLWR